MTRTTYKWLLFVRTAIRGIVSSPVTSGIAVVTIGVTLVLVGAFALLLRNMEELLDQFGDDLRVTRRDFDGADHGCSGAVAELDLVRVEAFSRTFAPEPETTTASATTALS